MINKIFQNKIIKRIFKKQKFKLKMQQNHLINLKNHLKKKKIKNQQLLLMIQIFKKMILINHIFKNFKQLNKRRHKKIKNYVI